ncbi:MAG: hypothetical protein R2834_18125 [Rhodothermales bacterium]
MRPLYLSAILFLAGCATSAPPLPEELAAAIPPGSNTIVVHSDLSLDEIFAEARRHLIGKGFDFVRYSTEMHLMATDQVEIGQSTALRIVLQAGSMGDASQVEAAGFWANVSAQSMMNSGPGSTGEMEHWEQAVWQGSERATLAFGQLALILNDLPHTQVLYLVK